MAFLGLTHIMFYSLTHDLSCYRQIPFPYLESLSIELLRVAKAVMTYCREVVLVGQLAPKFCDLVNSAQSVSERSMQESMGFVKKNGT